MMGKKRGMTIGSRVGFSCIQAVRGAAIEDKAGNLHSNHRGGVINGLNGDE